VAAIAAFSLFTFRDDGPDELVLGERATTTTVEVAQEEEPTSTTATTEAPATTETEDGVDGTWTLSPDSVAGYRVVEDFASGLSDFEAVGRTSEIDGTLTIDGTQVAAAGFSVDVASIISDDTRRDNQFKGPIMNSSDFPTADFSLTEPIELGTIPVEGEAITVDAVGELTLRGVTNAVIFPLTARLNNAGEIEALGSIDVLFSDYGIANPSNSLISVRDEGLVEFSLIFQR
ncbi:MAG: YceI family protein, partial [Acidimicrobiales bacterium]|nr:YceI family protein [Acidimicrobiales bacterium]